MISCSFKKVTRLTRRPDGQPGRKQSGGALCWWNSRVARQLASASGHRSRASRCQARGRGHPGRPETSPLHLLWLRVPWDRGQGGGEIL